MDPPPSKVLPLKLEATGDHHYYIDLSQFQHRPFEFTGYAGRAGHLTDQSIENILERAAKKSPGFITHYEGVVLVLDISAFTSSSQVTEMNKEYEDKSIALSKSTNEAIKKRNAKSRRLRKKAKDGEWTLTKGLLSLVPKKIKPQQIKPQKMTDEAAREKFPSEQLVDVPKETLDAADHLRGIVNCYMEALGEECLEYGGEIAQITGDFMVCVWAPRDNLNTLEEHQHLRPLRPKSMREAWDYAKACAGSIVKRVEPIQERCFPDLRTIGVHGAMTSGDITRIEVTNSEDKRSSYISGTAMKVASELLRFADKYRIVVVGDDNSIDHAKLVSTAPDKISVEYNGSMVTAAQVAFARRNPGMGQPGIEVITRDTQKYIALKARRFPAGKGRISAKILTQELVKAGLEKELDEYLSLSVLKFMQSAKSLDEPEQGVILDCGVLFVCLPNIGPKDPKDFAKDSPIWNSTHDRLGECAATLDKVVSGDRGHVVNFGTDDKGCVMMAYFPGRLPINAAVGCRKAFPDALIGVSKGRSCYCYSGVPNRRAIVALYSKATSYAARIAFGEDFIIPEMTDYNRRNSIIVQASALQDVELRKIGLNKAAVEKPVEMVRERHKQTLRDVWLKLITVREHFRAVVVNTENVKTGQDFSFDPKRDAIVFGHVRSANPNAE